MLSSSKLCCTVHRGHILIVSRVYVPHHNTVHRRRNNSSSIKWSCLLAIAMHPLTYLACLSSTIKHFVFLLAADQCRGVLPYTSLQVQACYHGASLNGICLHIPRCPIGCCFYEKLHCSVLPKESRVVHSSPSFRIRLYA